MRTVLTASWARHGIKNKVKQNASESLEIQKRNLAIVVATDERVQGSGTSVVVHLVCARLNFRAVSMVHVWSSVTLFCIGKPERAYTGMNEAVDGSRCLEYSHGAGMR